MRSNNRRSAGLVAGLACFSGALALACAGELTGNEEDYFVTRAPATGSGGASGSGGAGSGSATSTSGGASGQVGCDRISAIIDKNCKGCHNPDSQYGALDLISPGFEATLVDQPSSQTECGTLKRIDSANPAMSLIIDKVASADPACGDRMPFGLALSQEDIECVRAWVTSVATGGGS